MRKHIITGLLVIAFATPADARKHPANYLVPGGMYPAYRTVHYQPERKVMRHNRQDRSERLRSRHYAGERRPHKTMPHRDSGGAYGYSHERGSPDWCKASKPLRTQADWYRCRGKTTLPESGRPLVRAIADLAPDSQPELWAMGDALKPAYGKRPYKLAGELFVAGDLYRFVSGGAGWSIPYGHWKVTPDNVGRWGSRHGAIGLNNGDDMPDKQLGRERDGMEIHAAPWGRTAGCVGIIERYVQLKKAILAMIDQFGSAWLHITPSGASITPTKVALVVEGKVHAEAQDADNHERHHKHEHRLVEHHHHRQRFAGR